MTDKIIETLILAGIMVSGLMIYLFTPGFLDNDEDDSC